MRTGSYQTAIIDSLQSLQAALGTESGADCKKWLSQGTALRQWTEGLDNVFVSLPYIVGSASIRDQNGSSNSIIAINTNFIEGMAIIFNQGSSFYTDGGIGPGGRSAQFIGNIRGNSLRGREFIWLHELGHFLGLPGFVNDFNDDSSQSLHKHNNDAVWENCGKLLFNQ